MKPTPESKAGEEMAGEGSGNESDFSLSDYDLRLAEDHKMYQNPLANVHELYYVKARLEGT